jgi:hypothetical protein
MAIMNPMSLYQGKFQYIQEYRDRYKVIKRVCDKLVLKFGRCEDDARAMLVQKGITEPTTAQLKGVTDKVDEESHTIIFIYKTDRS